MSLEDNNKEIDYRERSLLKCGILMAYPVKAVTEIHKGLYSVIYHDYHSGLIEASITEEGFLESEILL